MGFSVYDWYVIVVSFTSLVASLVALGQARKARSLAEENLRLRRQAIRQAAAAGEGEKLAQRMPETRVLQ